MDLLLNSSTGDMIFNNGETNVTQLTADVVVQRLLITMKTFYGEWFLDTTVGVPYFQKIFGKTPKKATVDLIFQQLITNDADVLELLTFSSTLDTGTRGYSMTFSVRVADNTTSLPITVTIGG